MEFDLFQHVNHLLLRLLEVASQQSQEAIHVLQNLLGVGREGRKRLLAQADELQEDWMEVLVLYQSLVKLVDPRLFVEVLEDAEILIANELRLEV